MIAAKTTAMNMLETGDGFERALALAMIAGKDEQRGRIEAAFPEIMARYKPAPFQGDKPLHRGFVPTQCPGCKGWCDRKGECVNTGCAFGPDVALDETTAPTFGPDHPFEISRDQVGL